VRTPLALPRNWLGVAKRVNTKPLDAKGQLALIRDDSFSGYARAGPREIPGATVRGEVRAGDGRRDARLNALRLLAAQSDGSGYQSRSTALVP
jgi:hypothetical protein